MKVAITGGSGYIGSCLIKKLEQQPWIKSVLSIDVKLSNVQHGNKVNHITHDVTLPFDDLLTEFKPDVLVHLSFVLNPSHNKDQTHKINLSGLTNALQAVVKANVNYVIYFSSTTIYGAHSDNPEWLNEKSVIRPKDDFQYALDKAESEALIKDFNSNNKTIKTLILRGCPVMGPNADNFISRAFQKPVLIGIKNYNPPLQFIHEDDVVELMGLCMQKKFTGTYNIAGNGTMKWSEMAELIQARMIKLPSFLLYFLTEFTWQSRLQSESNSAGLDFIKYRWTVSTQKIKAKLNYQFRYSTQDVWRIFCEQRT